MDNSGKLIFGVTFPARRRPSPRRSPTTTGSGTTSPRPSTARGSGSTSTAQLVARNVAVTSGLSGLVGQWVLGGDTVSGWPSAPTSRYLNGTLDDVAIYPAALTRNQIRAHYSASGRTPTSVPTPTDAYGTAVTGSGPALYWRLGEAAGPSAADSSGLGESGTYAGTVAYGQLGAVGGTNTAVSVSGGTGTSRAPSTGLRRRRIRPRSGSRRRRRPAASSSASVTSRPATAPPSTATSPCSTRASCGSRRTSTARRRSTRPRPTATGSGTKVSSPRVPPACGSTSTATSSDPLGDDVAVVRRLLAHRRRPGGVAARAATSTASSTTSRSTPRCQLDRDRLHYKATGRTGSNIPPVAAFTPTVTKLVVALDGSASTDPDGTVAGYAWDFGDGTTGSGATTTHTYASAGTYTVSLTVTDNGGATNTVTRRRSRPWRNVAPTASFTKTLAGALVSPSTASGSSDSDGTVASYAWDFGDASTGTGATAQHTYAAPGTYTVTLTVTDNDGATATTTQSVTVLPANQLPTAVVLRRRRPSSSRPSTGRARPTRTARSPRTPGTSATGRPARAPPRRTPTPHPARTR